MFLSRFVGIRIVSAAIAVIFFWTQGGFAQNVSQLQSVHPKVQLDILQDVHCNSQTQNSIFSYLTNLNTQNNLSGILQEGASGKIDRSIWKQLDSAKRAKIVRGLYRDGWMGGAEKFAIEHPQIPYSGVELKALYEIHTDVYRDVTRKREAARESLRGLAAAAGRLKSKYYSSELIRLERQWQSARRDGNGLFLFLKNNLKNIPSTHWYEFGADFKNLVEAIKTEKASKNLSVDHFGAELERFYDILRTRLLPSDESRRLAKVLDYLNLLNDLWNLELTPESYEQFLSLESNIKLKIEIAYLLASEKQTPAISFYAHDNRNAAKAYYEMAKRRDEAIYRNVLRALKNKRGHFVLVAGGFHGRDLVRRFNNDPISVSLIQPQFSEIDPNLQEKYARAMGEFPTQGDLKVYLHSLMALIPVPVTVQLEPTQFLKAASLGSEEAAPDNFSPVKIEQIAGGDDEGALMIGKLRASDPEQTYSIRFQIEPEDFDPDSEIQADPYLTYPEAFSDQETFTEWSKDRINVAYIQLAEGLVLVVKKTGDISLAKMKEGKSFDSMDSKEDLEEITKLSTVLSAGPAIITSENMLAREAKRIEEVQAAAPPMAKKSPWLLALPLLFLLPFVGYLVFSSKPKEIPNFVSTPAPVVKVEPSAPVASPTPAPVASAAIASVETSTTTPVDSATVAKVGSSTIAVPGSASVSPVGSSTTAPMDLSSVSPVGSSTTAPTDLSSVAQVGSSTTAPTDSASVAKSDSLFSMTIDAKIVPAKHVVTSPIAGVASIDSSNGRVAVLPRGLMEKRAELQKRFNELADLIPKEDQKYQIEQKHGAVDFQTALIGPKSAKLKAELMEVNASLDNLDQVLCASLLPEKIGGRLLVNHGDSVEEGGKLIEIIDEGRWQIETKLPRDIALEFILGRVTLKSFKDVHIYADFSVSGEEVPVIFEVDATDETFPIQIVRTPEGEQEVRLADKPEVKKVIAPRAGWYFLLLRQGKVKKGDVIAIPAKHVVAIIIAQLTRRIKLMQTVANSYAIGINVAQLNVERAKEEIEDINKQIAAARNDQKAIDRLKAEKKRRDAFISNVEETRKTRRSTIGIIRQYQKDRQSLIDGELDSLFFITAKKDGVLLTDRGTSSGSFYAVYGEIVGEIVGVKGKGQSLGQSQSGFGRRTFLGWLAAAWWVGASGCSFLSENPNNAEPKDNQALAQSDLLKMKIEKVIFSLNDVQQFLKDSSEAPLVQPLPEFILERYNVSILGDLDPIKDQKALTPDQHRMITEMTLFVQNLYREMWTLNRSIEIRKRQLELLKNEKEYIDELSRENLEDKDVLAQYAAKTAAWKRETEQKLVDLQKLEVENIFKLRSILALKPEVEIEFRKFEDIPSDQIETLRLSGKGNTDDQLRIIALTDSRLGIAYIREHGVASAIEMVKKEIFNEVSAAWFDLNKKKDGLKAAYQRVSALRKELTEIRAKRDRGEAELADDFSKQREILDAECGLEKSWVVYTNALQKFKTLYLPHDRDVLVSNLINSGIWNQDVSDPRHPFSEALRCINKYSFEWKYETKTLEQSFAAGEAKSLGSVKITNPMLMSYLPFLSVLIGSVIGAKNRKQAQSLFQDRFAKRVNSILSGVSRVSMTGAKIPIFIEESDLSRRPDFLNQFVKQSVELHVFVKIKTREEARQKRDRYFPNGLPENVKMHFYNLRLPLHDAMSKQLERGGFETGSMPVILSSEAGFFKKLTADIPFIKVSHEKNYPGELVMELGRRIGAVNGVNAQIAGDERSLIGYDSKRGVFYLLPIEKLIDELFQQIVHEHSFQIAA